MRYTAIGGGPSAPIQQVFVAGEISHVIAQSPGAAVEAVGEYGDIEERVIGAFLDASPVDWVTPCTSEHLAYHRCVTAPYLNGWAVVNIPPIMKEAELEAIRCTEAPVLLPWVDFLAEVVGAEAVVDAWISLPDVLESSEAQLAAHWWVQRVERCRTTA